MFNNWSNRQTWIVHQWIQNSSELKNRWIPELKEDAEDKNKFLSILEAFFTEEIDNINPYIDDLDSDEWLIGIISDFVSSSLENVNWRELAEYHWNK